MVVRIGGYARISLDKNGEELGVERQRRDYRQVAGCGPAGRSRAITSTTT